MLNRLEAGSMVGCAWHCPWRHEKLCLSLTGRRDWRMRVAYHEWIKLVGCWPGLICPCPCGGTKTRTFLGGVEKRWMLLVAGCEIKRNTCWKLMRNAVNTTLTIQEASQGIIFHIYQTRSILPFPHSIVSFCAYTTQRPDIILMHMFPKILLHYACSSKRKKVNATQRSHFIQYSDLIRTPWLIGRLIRASCQPEGTQGG